MKLKRKNIQLKNTEEKKSLKKVEHDVKRVVKQTVTNTSDDWQHCCKYCHWYNNQNGCCEIGGYYDALINPMNTAVEEGIFEEIFNEAISYGDYRDTFRRKIEIKLRELGLSEKRNAEAQKEILGDFLDDFLDEIKTDLGDNLPSRIDDIANEQMSEFYGCSVTDENTQCCGEWC